MKTTVFFSWQADTPNRNGRTFLNEVLEKICSNISADTIFEEALRVDSDTQGVAGQPPIADTIFKKIDSAGIFFADVTFTGKRIDKRPTPNPNVLIEYGWALKSLLHERVICIMNTAYGEPNKEDLPFDMAHLRWPVTYNLRESATPEEKNEEKQRLIKVLEKAIRASLATIKLPELSPVLSFPAETAKNGPARFRKPGEEIGFDQDLFNRSSVRQIYLDEGPAIWFRLIPTIKQPKKWVNEELKKIISKDSKLHLEPLHTSYNGFSYLQAADGIGMYSGPSSTSEDMNVPSITFLFRTGEIWSIDTTLLKFGSGFIAITTLEQNFVASLKRYAIVLNMLGIKSPYGWEAGLVGAKGMKLGYEPPPGKQWLDSNNGPQCLADEIFEQGLFNEGDNPISTLLPFFEKIFEESGKKRPDYLPR